jgi:hypothetical protein
MAIVAGKTELILICLVAVAFLSGCMRLQAPHVLGNRGVHSQWGAFHAHWASIAAGHAFARSTCRARSLAVLSPMPLLALVITTTLSAIFDGLIF